jgi:hypothetical protein
MNNDMTNDEDMNSGAGVNGGDGASHMEVAPPPGGDYAAEVPTAQPVAEGPRSFPQHYKLLFGAFCVLIGSMAVWQREHVFGVEIEGNEMISGNLLMILSGYCVLVGILNIMNGRLAGMLAAFLTGIAALYFGLPGIWNTYGHDAFLTHAEIDTYFNSVSSGEGEKIPLRFAEQGLPFPSEAIKKFKTENDKWYYTIGQIAPGPIFSTLGGFLMIFVFAGAVFGGKKKGGSEPPPTARRRRRCACGISLIGSP